MALFVGLAVFVAITALVLSFQYREQERAGFSTERLARAMGRAPHPGFVLPSVGLRGSRISSNESLRQLLTSFSLTHNLERELMRSDWNRLKVSGFLLISGTVGLLPFIIAARLTGQVSIGVAVGVICLFIPRYLLGRNVKKRRNLFNNQMIEVLSQMANSLKAGFGLMQAMSLAADEAKPPISTELRGTIHDIQVGSSVEDAFNDLDERVGSDDLDIVITAILIQRTAGGSLAEIIEGVAHTMRERIRIRGEINTLTTQGKYTGYLIGALPIFLAIGFFIVNRRYEALLFTTDLGHIMLIGWGIMQGFGLFLIRRILNIEI